MFMLSPYKDSSTFKRLLLIAAACIPTLSGYSPAQAPIKGAFAHFPPLTYINEQNEASGYLVDIMNKVLDEADLTVTWRSYPSKRIVQHIASGAVELFPIYKGHTEIEKVSYSGNSVIYSFSMRAYYFDGHKPIIEKEDLFGKSIILMRGYNYTGWSDYITDPDNQIQLFYSDNHQQALAALKANRGDYLLSYKSPVEFSLEKSPEKNLQHSDLTNLDLYFFTSKQTINAIGILEKLDQAYQRLIERGEL